MALENYVNGKLITSEIHAEFMFCLGPSNNVKKSLDLVQVHTVCEIGVASDNFLV